MGIGLTPKEFSKYVNRDKHCLHCGADGDDLIPHHRANRGHGGYKAGNNPANIIVMCAIINGLMESDSRWAQTARDRGWKISRYDNPETSPVYDATTGSWWLLDARFGRSVGEKNF